MVKDAILPKWKYFDLEWYNNRYHTFSVLIQDIYQGNSEGYYQKNGCKLGHSPNPYFDEKWYVNHYPEVKTLIQQGKYVSGYDHYCQEGYRDHSPHWLFSETYYLQENPHLTQENLQNNGFLNGYDHYLKVGDSGLYSGSYYFNPRLYLLQKKQKEAVLEKGPYQYLLTEGQKDCDSLRVSWFFDPFWYFLMYPQVEDAIKRHEFINGLHHYLTNDTPTVFSPVVLFSEEYYLKVHPDLAGAIAPDGRGLFRNGYEHFLRHGYQENRKPFEGYDKSLFSPFNDGLQDKDGLKEQSGISYHNDFEYYLACQNQTLFQKLHPQKPHAQKNHSQIIVVQEAAVAEDRKEDQSIGQVERQDNIPEAYQSQDEVPSKVSEVPEKKQPENVLENTPETILVEAQRDRVEETALAEEVIASDLPPNESYIEQQDIVQQDKEQENSSYPVFQEEQPVTEPTLFQQIEIRKLSEPEIRQNQTSQVPLWKLFDEEWYVRIYHHVTTQMKALELDSIEEYYLSFGRFEGHSPNPYFDEEWYLQQYPEVKSMIDRRDIASGFEHYCKEGYHTHSPHWLFSEDYYLQENPYLTAEYLQDQGYVNRYDHYLKAGDQERLSGSPFFDPVFFLEHLRSGIPVITGAYQYYLKHLDKLDMLTLTSWYFDPAWYVQQYSFVRQEIEEGKFFNPLHHYLTNRDARDFAPLKWFDENFYAEQYGEQLKSQKGKEQYRNGYAHFLQEGIQDLWNPCAIIDLEAYSLTDEVQQDMQNKAYPNVYVHWIATHQHEVNEGASLKAATEKREKQNRILSQHKDPETAVWAEFNEDWYLAQYKDTREKMAICGIDNVRDYYYQVGAFLKHSPNPYFDEEWYLNTHSDVKKAVDRGIFTSGFDHYRQKGYLDGRSPHWLFSENHYLRNNPEFTYEIHNSPDFVNVYDHYLKKGDALLKTGSLFFDPLVYQSACYQKGRVEEAGNPYKNYLLNLRGEDQDTDVSLYFDTGWYLRTYPEIRGSLELGEYKCAMHHYFMSRTPLAFNPSPWFSEDFYLQTHSDLVGSIPGAFRNGYEHFVLYGSLECRQPCEQVNLRAYFLQGTVREDIENGFYRDAFAAWVFEKKVEQWLEKQPEDSNYRLSEEVQQSRSYFQKRSRLLVPAIAHKKLDFSYEGKPEISVIMLVHNHLPVTLAALASLRANFSGKIQLLLGDNHSTDDCQYIQKSLIGAKTVRFPYNLGYGKACNYLIEQVKAPITLFLNNDLSLMPGAIDALCQRLVSANDIGAVGGKIIHPDGKLQEAGGIIWRDGTTYGYLRGDDPSLPQVNFVRDVDYCSAAMLAVKTDLLKRLKGFSPLYYPAYFEDTDLCVRILQAGYRIVYDPDAVVEHMEYASSDPIVSSGLIRRNHRQFVKEHADFLRYQSPRHTDNILIARQRRGKRKRILFIEDRVPLRHLGSGYVRSNSIIHHMAALGYEVTVYPINPYYPHMYQIFSDLPETVEILFNHTIEGLRDFLKERAGYYDAVWIGRTHNLQRILPMMGEANRYLPQDAIILDTEVIAAPRTQLRARILGLPVEETLEAALEEELSCARHCQQIITVNQIDANYARQAGFDNVDILGHEIVSRITPKKWEERRDILFVGALHDDLSPNFDSLQWFLSAVLPMLRDQLQEEFKISIAGYVHPSVDMSMLARYPNVNLLGAVEDLTPLYASHRVYIAPTRFAGGIPYKLHEAASFGLPIVASDMLVKQLGWRNDEDILAASIDNPESFVEQIIRLYQTETLWNTIRYNAIKRIKADCDPVKFRNSLSNILSNVISYN